jgi:hypothetical protein
MIIILTAIHFVVFFVRQKKVVCTFAFHYYICAIQLNFALHAFRSSNYALALKV